MSQIVRLPPLGRLIAVLALVIQIVGCGGGGGGGGGGSGPTLVSIAVTPTNPTIAKSTFAQLTATGTYSDNTTQDLTGSATWSSSNTAVASVGSSAGSYGLASGLAPGTSTMTASVGSVSGATLLTVTSATIVSISATPATASIGVGATEQYTATGVFSDNSRQDLTKFVTWSSSNTAIASTSNTSASKGLATAIAVGTSTISAAFGGVTGSANLTVTAATLASIAITPTTPSIPAGTAWQLTATGTYSDGSTRNLTTTATWTSSTLSVATISNVAGSNGIAFGLAVGTSTITASVGSVAGTTVLTVTPATIVSISVTPTAASIGAGSTQQYTATGVFSDNSRQDLTRLANWTSSNTAVALISNAAGSNGLATGIAVGTSTISATFGGVRGSVNLTVTAATLVAITVTPAFPSIPAGTGRQFTATGTYSDNSIRDLTTIATWASSATNVATIGNILGSYGFASGLAAGTSTITASVGAIAGTTRLTVTPATCIGIAITPLVTSIGVGSTVQYIATGTFSDGSMQDLTQLAVWNSSDASVASISNAAASSGLATAIAVGPSTISATFDGVIGTASLTVTPATLVPPIAVTPAAPSIAAGTAQQFTATGTYSDGSTRDLTTTVTWGSSNLGIATIGNTAGSYGTATAVAPGMSTITASLGSVSGQANLTVTPAVLIAIAITPTDPSVVVGANQQLNATGTYSDGTIQDITTTAIWNSATPSVATISNAAGSNGLLTAAATGTSTITATSGSIVGTTLATVSPIPLPSIGAEAFATTNTSSCDLGQPPDNVICTDTKQPDGTTSSFNISATIGSALGSVQYQSGGAATLSVSIGRTGALALPRGDGIGRFSNTYAVVSNTIPVGTVVPLSAQIPISGSITTQGDVSQTTLCGESTAQAIAFVAVNFRVLHVGGNGVQLIQAIRTHRGNCDSTRYDVTDSNTLDFGLANNIPVVVSAPNNVDSFVHSDSGQVTLSPLTVNFQVPVGETFQLFFQLQSVANSKNGTASSSASMSVAPLQMGSPPAGVTLQRVP